MQVGVQVYRTCLCPFPVFFKIHSIFAWSISQPYILFSKQLNLRHFRRGRKRSLCLVAHTGYPPHQHDAHDVHRNTPFHGNALCHFHIAASINPATGETKLYSNRRKCVLDKSCRKPVASSCFMVDNSLGQLISVCFSRRYVFTLNLLIFCMVTLLQLCKYAYAVPKALLGSR